MHFPWFEFQFFCHYFCKNKKLMNLERTKAIKSISGSNPFILFIFQNLRKYLSTRNDLFFNVPRAIWSAPFPFFRIHLHTIDNLNNCYDRVNTQINNCSRVLSAFS